MSTEKGASYLGCPMHGRGFCPAAWGVEPSRVLIPRGSVVYFAPASTPGARGRTSTFALANAILPCVIRLANDGYKKAALADPGPPKGIDVQEGRLTNEAVDATFGMEFQPAALS